MDASTSTLLPLAKLAKRISPVRGDNPPSRTTLYRWCMAGLKTQAGQRVRLEFQFIGGTICSTEDAVHRLGDRIKDRVWKEIPLVTQRERADEQRRARAAMDALRNWSPRKTTR